MADTLNHQFGIPNAVTVAEGNGGLPRVILTHASGSSCEVYLHGAHIASWKNTSGEELFFLSRESWWSNDKPIRGGIPVVFPQFGGRGPLPAHGFARTSEWQLVCSEVLDSGIVTSDLQLTESAWTLAAWPHRFAFGLRVMLDENALTVGAQVTNTGEQAFEFMMALHTYFQVADITKTAVVGLQGTTCIDTLQENARIVESRPAIRFAAETDSVYPNAPDALRVEDEGNRRTIAVDKMNMPDVVVWNPWIAKSRRMADFGDDEYQRMVCVETGTIETNPTLAPGSKWEGETTFRVE
jgi:glucose-6-phosphate 1-epimerase